MDTGGSNIQFGVNPRNGPPGCHRDESPSLSQLGPCFQGHRFPIARSPAKLAVGYYLDEIRNDITRETPACSNRQSTT